MTRFIVRRLIQSLLILFVIMIMSFALSRLAPGGPEALYFDNAKITPEQIAATRKARGLDDPIPVQFARWFWDTVRFDFGTSTSYARRDVIDVVWAKIGPTFQLGLMSYAIGLLGIPLGIWAAYRRGKIIDNIIRVFTVVGTAVPSFWLGLLVIIVLVNYFKWFPQGQGEGSPASWFGHIIFPALILGFGPLVVFTRYVRNEVIETLGQDYVRTAKSKGLPGSEVTNRHVLRNSLIPVVTLLGGLLPGILGGAAITESIFNWPGMGQLFITAAGARDYSLLLFILMFGTVLTLIGTLLSDIAYGWVDPRIRYD